MDFDERICICLPVVPLSELINMEGVDFAQPSTITDYFLRRFVPCRLRVRPTPFTKGSYHYTLVLR